MEAINFLKEGMAKNRRCSNEWSDGDAEGRAVMVIGMVFLALKF